MTVPPASSPPAPLTLLFVDDEPAIIRSILRILRGRREFTVLTATSAEQALGTLRTCNVDILVSDIDMPQMNGLELMRLAQRDFPATLRILLTGAGTMDRAVKAINEGEVVRFFAKPFDVDRFTRALEELGDRILRLRRERRSEAQKERCDELFLWVAGCYPGALDFERNDEGEVVVDPDRVNAFLEIATPEVRAFARG